MQPLINPLLEYRYTKHAQLAASRRRELREQRRRFIAFLMGVALATASGLLFWFMFR
jgi:hypothetical protein